MNADILLRATYLFANAFRVYTVFVFISLFVYRKKGNRIKEFVFYFVFFAINSAIHLLWNNPIVNALDNLVFIFLILRLFYRAKFITSIVVTLAIVSIIIVVENIVAIMLYGITPDLFESAIILIVSCWALYAIVMMIKNHMDMKSDHTISIVQTILISSISAICIFLALVITFPNMRNNHFLIVISLVLLLLINFMVVYLYNSVKDRANQVRIQEMLRQHNNLYIKQYQTNLESQKSIQILRHDLKGHMSAIQSMIENNKQQEALNYIHAVCHTLDYRALYAHSGNIAIDSVINSKAGEGNQLGIDYCVKIAVPAELKIASFDLSAILYNLLDNALYAVKGLHHCEKRIIDISIEFDRGLLYIHIKNPYDGNLNYKNGIIITTRKDSYNHGYGLQSVQKAIDKYNGIMRLNQEDNFFIVDVMLYNTAPAEEGGKSCVIPLN